VAGNKDNDDLPSTSIGRFPFTPAPEDQPAPEHNKTAEIHSSESDSGDKVSQSLIPNPSTMTESSHHSALKTVTDPLDDSNFATWRFKILAALGYQMLDDYVLEDDHKELKKDPKYKEKKKLATTFIRMHLNEENANRFVGHNYKTYEPKELWDTIHNHFADQSIENTANIWDKLYDIRFGEDNMKEAVNTFRTTFQLLIEVSAGKLDKNTLELCWIFLLLKRLPSSFAMFRSIQFATMKNLIHCPISPVF
jgi:hypothetical protein